MKKDTAVDAPGRCQNCKSAKRKEKVRWICRKNCVERNNIDTCMMKPVQFEPIEQPRPEQEYIISDKDRTYILCHPEDIRTIYGIMERSRPHSPLQDNLTIACIEQARQDEREKVLDELRSRMLSHVPTDFLAGTYRMNDEWMEEIESLRAGKDDG